MFRVNGFKSKGPKNIDAPDIHSYETSDDTLSQVLAADYFADPRAEIRAGDMVLVKATDGSATCVVTNPTTIEEQEPQKLKDMPAAADVASAVNTASKLGGQPVIWMGIDSLTAGAFDASYIVPFQKFARGVVGWGGRWVQFTNVKIGTESSIFKSGMNLVEDLTFSDIKKKMSLDGYGAYATTGANINFQLEPEFNWTYADLYYLQQPTGATVAVDKPEGQAALSLNTSGTLSVQKIRQHNFLRNGSTNGGTTTVTNGIRIRNTSIVGDLCVYGVVFYSGDSGPVYINAAKGGRLASEAVQLDGATQSEWFEMLGITHAIVSAGMNDRTTRTPVEFEADLTTICERFDESVTQLIIRPNDPSDGLLDQYDAAYASVAADYGQLVNLVDLYGNYSSVNGQGLMADSIHTNQHYQYRQAQHYCNLLFTRSFYTETPKLIDYEADDTQSLLTSSNKDLDLRVTALEP